MLPIEKLDALLAGITRADLERLPPAHRQRLAQMLRCVANLADPPEPSPEPPKAGFISELRDGRGRE